MLLKLKIRKDLYVGLSGPLILKVEARVQTKARTVVRTRERKE